MLSYLFREEDQKTIGWSLTFTAGLLVIIYNIMLMVHLAGESVSINMHENYVTKKEVEFCVGISTNWLTRYYFFFSSFKGGLQ